MSLIKYFTLNNVKIASLKDVESFKYLGETKNKKGTQGDNILSKKELYTS